MFPVSAIWSQRSEVRFGEAERSLGFPMRSWFWWKVICLSASSTSLQVCSYEDCVPSAVECCRRCWWLLAARQVSCTGTFLLPVSAWGYSCCRFPSCVTGLADQTASKSREQSGEGAWLSSMKWNCERVPIVCCLVYLSSIGGCWG